MYYSVIVQFTLMTGVHYVMTNMRGSNSMASAGMHKGWEGAGREWLALRWEGGRWLLLPRVRASQHSGQHSVCLVLQPGRS